MKAFTKTTYGGPEVLKLEEVEKPEIQKDQILVKVMANSANAADWRILRGTPFLARFAFGLFKPKDKILGADFAGIVEETGSEVQNFKKGDSVFGEASKGAFAEFLEVNHQVCAKMPEGTTFQEMTGLAMAGVTAYQGIVTQGQVQAGESILINGGSGGVGHFAVQIAKIYGATVTAVCSKKNAELVKSLGADEVIPYDEQDIHQHSTKYDLVVDTHGNLTLGDYKRMGRRGVIIGFTSMGSMLSLILKSVFSKFPLKQFTANPNTNDLETLADLVAAKKLKVHVDKTYPYHEIPDAIAYIEAMHTKGKVIMTWKD